MSSSKRPSDSHLPAAKRTKQDEFEKDVIDLAEETAEHTSDTQPLTTGSLDSLQSQDSREVMDIVDKLRRTGLDSVINLPQIVVCGDQSSGKSSVLEAITEIPFPRKENLCTRFATEIILRRATTSSISTKIIPDKTRSFNEQKMLQDFKKTINNFSELPALMDEVTTLMGLHDATGTTPRAFSRDVLSIEISGPRRAQLTLVDLPGLIHAENKSQSNEDVELIKGLVEEYVSNKRTIILAVVSAKNDYANQIILKKARDVDSKGSRTLGIITKPDFLVAGSENELAWLDLASNKDIYFELGWHMLKNRSEKKMNRSFEERNRSEKHFFSQGRYRDLDPNTLGIEALRERLSGLLHGHLKKELPQLQKELDTKYQDTVNRLRILGESRSTVKEQRRFLMAISSRFQKIADAAVDGYYDDNFFGNVNPEQSIDDISNMKRLRAVVQHLNLQFAAIMRRYGHKYKIGFKDTDDAGVVQLKEDDEMTDPDVDATYANSASPQVCKTRPEAIQWVKTVLQRSRGRELPGNFNPLLINELFKEQSKSWEALALAHVGRISTVCETFVRALLKEVASPDVSTRLYTHQVNPALKSRLAAAQTELSKIIQDKDRHPITYNHYYTSTIQKIRNQRNTYRIDKLAKQATSTNVAFGVAGAQEQIDPTKLRSVLQAAIEPDMDKFSAEDALDSQIAYYKDELKYFVNVVTKQVIERYLVQNLAAETISPMIVGDMSDDEIRFGAAEPAEVSKERAFLDSRRKTLEAGQETFRNAIGVFR